MPNGVFNWSYNDVTKLLKSKGFQLRRITGSHHFYAGTIQGNIHTVCVPKHGSTAYRPRTLNSMVKQSGLTKEEWGIK